MINIEDLTIIDIDNLRLSIAIRRCCELPKPNKKEKISPNYGW